MLQEGSTRVRWTGARSGVEAGETGSTGVVVGGQGGRAASQSSRSSCSGSLMSGTSVQGRCHVNGSARRVFDERGRSGGEVCDLPPCADCLEAVKVCRKRRTAAGWGNEEVPGCGSGRGE